MFVLVAGSPGLTFGVFIGGSPKAAPTSPKATASSTASPSTSASPSASTITEPAHHCTYIQSGTAAKR